MADIFNRPGVAGAVLETALWLNNLLTRRGSPVDDKPSTNKLHHFVQKKKKKKKMWHMTCDTLHMTCDSWHVWGGEHSLKISAP